ncbi:MAG: hypothetical protein QJR07_19070 [Acetobacteraceae bacterium]|nr:hypothetical protein [Acetobacteraceae bacterium]
MSDTDVDVIDRVIDAALAAAAGDLGPFDALAPVEQGLALTLSCRLLQAACDDVARRVAEGTLAPGPAWPAVLASARQVIAQAAALGLPVGERPNPAADAA